jgi:CHRD domain-containing protein
MKISMLVAAALLAGLVPALVLASPKTMHPTLSAKLVGTAEVPKGAPSGHGIVNLTLNTTKGTVCWTFEGVTGIDKPTAAHIHKAPAGRAGAVVVPFGAAYKAKNCQTAPKTVIDAIESNPNAYYVNVHTATYPNGAIRGQLVAGMMHM